jgi:hypothetical protein
VMVQLRPGRGRIMRGSRVRSDLPFGRGAVPWPRWDEPARRGRSARDRLRRVGLGGGAADRRQHRRVRPCQPAPGRRCGGRVHPAAAGVDAFTGRGVQGERGAPRTEPAGADVVARSIRAAARERARAPHREDVPRRGRGRRHPDAFGGRRGTAGPAVRLRGRSPVPRGPARPSTTSSAPPTRPR